MAKFLVYFLILILVKAQIILAMMEPPMASRKLGKLAVLHKIEESRLSPAEAPNADGSATEVSASGGETGPAGDEEVMEIHHPRHRSIDKSVAGGGVILGGLATTFLVAIFCYIRATRRRSTEPGSPTNSDLSGGRRNGEQASPVNL